ncbi:MAG: type I methionyl aminopeptidase [Alphaproteobacteria bacterium]|nr:type I methionyl aminopeptidase [Alphaproteobacteria bacterium]
MSKSQKHFLSPEDFQGMRKAGTLARQTLEAVAPLIKPGITSNALNDFCHDFIVKHNAYPAPLNYKGFPKSICTSINHVVCHGIPNDRILKEGSILNIDVTVCLDGYYGDTSITFLVGDVSASTKKLVDTTHDALIAGIKAARDFRRLGDIGHAIESLVLPKRYSIVEDYCGHGIGKAFHTYPSVLHFGKPNTGDTLETGMCITIEPMINAGKADTKVLSDDWTVVTRDRSLSAQFEHTVGFTESGIEVFTMSESDKKRYQLS